MIITEFPLFGLLYIRTKLLWTLPGFCYILISEKNTACIQAADEVIEKALEKAAGEKVVRKAIEGGMSATDAFAKYGIL